MALNELYKYINKYYDQVSITETHSFILIIATGIAPAESLDGTKLQVNLFLVVARWSDLINPY